ncbi:MAG TPA: MBL fold metallo-hydrolase [Spirochaetia bacterium]
MVKLSESIWYTEPVTETDRPVLALIRGTRRSLMVDGGNSPRHAREFLQELREADVAGPDLIAITHAHCDHLFGLGELGGLVIANRLTDERMKELAALGWDDAALERRVENGLEFASTLNMLRIEMPGDRGGLVVRAADIVYRDELALDLGGIECRLRRVGGGHTRDSAVVWVPRRRIVFLGDCLYCNQRDENVLDELYGTLMSMDADLYVDSHLERVIERKYLRDTLYS